MGDHDVIVLGTGAAGMTAAVTAAELGAKALESLRALSNDTISDEMAATCIDVGPEMVRRLDERTPVTFRAVPDLPDHHPEQPGAANDERGMGLAPGGRLSKACLDRGVEPQTGHRAVELIREDGVLAGVVFETSDGRKEVRAANVVIAAGGFAGGLGGTEKARTDWITSGDTPTEPAEKLGVPADALGGTLARFNANARDLHDSDYNRGWSAQDRWRDDPTLHDGTARASLGPVETAPYDAIQVFSGALGTKGGPATDRHARVGDVDGDVIGGLYAAGKAMASPLGMTYGGAGGTLGPAMVSGSLAGRDIAQRAAAKTPSALASA